MTKVTPMGGAFLTKDNVSTGDVLTIMDEGKYVDKEFKGKKKKAFEITVQIEDGADGITKTANLNATSFNLLIKHFGDDTADWVGKEVRAEVITQNIQGEMKKVVYITPPNVDATGEIIAR